VAAVARPTTIAIWRCIIVSTDDWRISLVLVVKTLIIRQRTRPSLIWLLYMNDHFYPLATRTHSVILLPQSSSYVALCSIRCVSLTDSSIDIVKSNHTASHFYRVANSPTPYGQDNSRGFRPVDLQQSATVFQYQAKAVSGTCCACM
jgi:hypothetical protein